MVDLTSEIDDLLFETQCIEDLAETIHSATIYGDFSPDRYDGAFFILSERLREQSKKLEVMFKTTREDIKL